MGLVFISTVKITNIWASLVITINKDMDRWCIVMVLSSKEGSIEAISRAKDVSWTRNGRLPKGFGYIVSFMDRNWILNSLVSGWLKDRLLIS